MKKLIYILTLLALTSCNKFLDVKPESQIDKDELFTTEEGYKEALNGVYTFCSSQSLYGENLTYGNLDILAQNYEFTDLSLRRIANFDYEYPAMVGFRNTVWANTYRAIANCNYILENIDARRSLFSGNNYQLIKGETLLLRAYLHFDMLRLFAPSYKSNPAARGIPYVTKVSTQSTPFSTVAESVDKVIAELNEAKALLKDVDPIVSGYQVGYPSDLGSPEVNNPDLFMQNRRHRMNYFTACGELARAYLYKNDMANALVNTRIIINSNRFPWTAEADFFEQDVTKRDRIFYKELISAWYVNDNKGIRDRLIDIFSDKNPTYAPTSALIDDIYERAQSGADDWRYKQWYFRTTIESGSSERSLLQKYISNTTPTPNRHPLVMPTLRLSEIYYIAAEASFDTNPTEAVEYFNALRRHRGIGEAVSAQITKEDFISKLVVDARKEFYGESQIFYMYKRLNRAVKVSATINIPPSDRIFVLPLPTDEEAYRNN
ncbi:RagB/SusD family nutrient uptake outer membrane protein [Mucilaginibacter sp. UR6-1]|uniref:RagB/SusD family nutrient uptake outer membrane protein n=1 Tax=Mucilaginibacter sp. UR6-1 TaxID=1435643 RepID=UPI001E5B5D3A|nr:RagB/SusD family nutrient uptake outer membrane protein [Mucilaginibacter sp. UR6-1]MCC8408180.1 RagB/SusD family nutrient uptake outer membrane protein [Mucilaginibacter sp. UR6-1]